MCAKSSQVARKSVGSSVLKAAKEAVSKKKKKSKKSKKRTLDLIIDEEVPPVKVPKIDADDFDLVDSYQETVENGETVQIFDSFLQFSRSHRKKLRKKVNEGKFTVEGEYYVFEKSPGYPKSKVKAELFNGMGPSWKDMPKPAWKIAQEQKEVDCKPGKNDKMKLRDVEAYEDPRPKEFKLFSNEEILLYTDPPLDFFKLFENGDFYENGKLLVFPPEENGSLKRGISAKNYRKHSTLLADCPDIPPEMFFYERTVPFTPEKCSS